MSDLGANDLVLMLNKRVIRNLAISVDHAFQRSVEGAVVLLDLAAALDPTVGTWVNRGLEHPIEIVANLALPVPRSLYATTNPAFSPVPAGTNDRETLINRLRQYDLVAPGPVVGTIPANAQIQGVPLANPCDVIFKEDPNRRFTFLRGGFFHNNAPSFLEVTASGLEMTLTGTAYRGDLFSRHRAMHNPTHTFEMKLLYKAQFLNNSDINLGPVPFRMVANPPPPTGAGLPSLPAIGKLVFARRFDNGKFVLPTLVPDENDPNILVQPPRLLKQLFNGQLDDLIYESAEPMPFIPFPRYRVEPKSDDEPERFVIREIGNSIILAEAQAGRLVLAFDSLVSLDLQPNDVSPAEKALIGNSLCKIQPTLSQAFTCAAGLAAEAVNMNILSLLGPEGLDFPIMPRSVVVPLEAQIVTQANMLPGPLDSVWSSDTTCDLTAEKYFPHPNPQQQAFAVAGKIGGSGDPGINDFSAGADLSIGVSQVFIQPSLDQMAEDAKGQILANPPPGLDGSTLQVYGIIDTDAFRIFAEGDGEIETPFFLPNFEYDFEAAIRIRFRAKKKVIEVGGQPVDRFHCPIAYNPGAQLSLEPPAEYRNPLSYLTYFDPHQGIACFDNCPLPVRVPPPVLDADGNEIVIVDPDNPPNICEDPNTEDKEQAADDEDAFGEVSFQLSENDALEHEWVIEPITPKDDDVDVSVDINFGALFLSGLVGVLFAALGAPLTAFAVVPLLMTFPLVNLIASAVATGEVEDRLAEQNLPSFNRSLNVASFLEFHLENPEVRPSFTLQAGPAPQPGAFIIRYRVLVRSDGLNVGI